MKHERRLEQLEQVIGSDPVMIRVLRIPAHRWRAEPPLSPAEREAYTARVLGPFGAAA